MRYLLLVAIAACGYPELPGSSVDAPPGTGPDAPPGTCPAPATYGTPTLTPQQAAIFDDGSNPRELAYDGVMTDGLPSDILNLILAEGSPGLFATGFRTGTFALTDPNEHNFASCSACVVVSANCNNCRPEDAMGTGDYYMATSGSITLTTISATRITGTLTNINLVHVTIENTGSTPTLISHPVNDGCTTKIASAAFNSPVTAAP